MKQRAIILTENGISIFRQDFTVNGTDDLENDIVKFIVEIEHTKGMISINRIMRKLSQKADMTKFLKENTNIALKSISSDIKMTFSDENIKHAIKSTR